MKALRPLFLLLAWGAVASSIRGADWGLVTNKRIFFGFPEAIGDWVAAGQSGQSNGIPIDVNQDGVPDFVLQATYDNGTVITLMQLGNNQVLVGDTSWMAIGVPGGTWIDSHPPDGTYWCGQGTNEFGPPFGAMLWYSLSAIGDWGQGVGGFADQRLFAAVRIQEADGWHYGALDLKGSVLLDAGVLYQIGYESQPGVGILTIPHSPALMPLAPPAVVRPGQLRLSWQSEIGKAYQVQATGDLSALSWTNLDLTLIGTSTNTTADIPITTGARFFRVAVVQ